MGTEARGGKWETFVQSMLDGVCVTNPNGILTQVNRTLVELYGFRSEEDLVGKSLFSMVSKEDTPKLKKRFGESVRDKKPIIKNLEATIVRKDGKVAPVVLNITNLWSEEGKYAGSVSVIRDITERKKVEEELQASARQWHSTFDAISDAVCLLDLEGRILQCNKAMASFVGKPFSEIIGCFCYELVHGRLEPIEGCPVVCMRETCCRETMSLPMRSRWFDIVADPLLNEDGRLLGAVHIITDITERKKTEEALKSAKHDLEIRAEEKARELEEAQTKLIEAERLATLGKMASAVAHELKNPMGVIKLATYSLRKKVDPKDKNLIKHLENIDKKVTESDQIIKDLLAFSRASELEFAPTDLNKCVEEALKTTEQQIKAYNVKIIKVLDPQVPKIVADSGELVEIFYNMFLNAAQAMKESKKRELAVSTRYQDKFVEIEISDTGCGISKEDLKKLGEPFFSTKVKGIGLGLYITYEIIRKHKGDIEVKSKVGKGTTFVIKLLTNPRA